MQTNRSEQEGVPIHPGSIVGSSQVQKRTTPGNSPPSAHLDLLGDLPWPHADGVRQEFASGSILRPVSLRQGSVPEHFTASPRVSMGTPRNGYTRDEKAPGPVTPSSKADSKGDRRTTDSGDHLNAVLLGHTHSQIRLRWPAGQGPRNLLVRSCPPSVTVTALVYLCCLLYTSDAADE